MWPPSGQGEQGGRSWPAHSRPGPPRLPASAIAQPSPPSHYWLTVKAAATSAGQRGDLRLHTPGIPAGRHDHLQAVSSQLVVSLARAVVVLCHLGSSPPSSLCALRVTLGGP